VATRTKKRLQGRPTTVSVVDLANDRHPWDRQPKESDRAWAAFIVYRDLGIGRSIRAAVERLGKNKRYNGTAQQMSARYGWRIRVEAFDRERDRIRREEAEKVERELHRVMAAAYRRVAELAQQQNITLRGAAYRIAIERVSEAAIRRGVQ